MGKKLITTPLVDTWPIDEEVIFLGTWCLEPVNNYPDLNYEVCQYHWDDSDKLLDDETYLDNIYFKVLPLLARELNRIHEMNWSDRAWQLMIGPWLRRYITIIYDRYQCIQIAIKNYEIDEVCCSKVEAGDLTPFDRDDFSEKYRDSYWNYKIFSKIIIDTTDLKIAYLDVRPDSINTKHPVVSPTRYDLKSIVRGILNSKIYKLFEGMLSKRSKYYLYQTYLKDIKLSCQLSLKLGIFPTLSAVKYPQISSQLDKEIRKDFIIENISSNDAFENYLTENIPEFFPVVYLEGWAQLRLNQEKQNFPENPDAIFTAIGIYTNDCFKYWAAEKIQNGTKLIVGQHGGEYATTKISSEFLPHELAISDHYLSWGWNLPEKNITEVPSLILCQRKSNECWDENGDLLVICRFLKRYCYTHTSAMLPGKRFISYRRLLNELIGNLSYIYMDNLKIRLHPGEQGEAELEIPLTPMFKNNFPGVDIVSHKNSLESYFQKSRLNIFTYDGTTFLESMGAGRPCILISDPVYEPFSELAQPFYDELEKVGIYHRTVDSAIDHINNIFENTPSWWNSSEVKTIRHEYCNTFVRRSANPVGDIAKAIENISE